MGAVSLHRDQVIAALLVTGVVVVVGYASGLGLRTTTNPGQVAASPAPVQQPAPPTLGRLPEAVAPPAMMTPGDSLPADTVPSDASPVDDAPTMSMPPSGSAAPVVIAPPPGAPSQPAPAQPALPGYPAAPEPGACVPGAAQAVADTANSVVGGLPAAGTLTGSLGLTESSDGSSPGALNVWLYSVTGYCPTPAPTPSSPTLTVPGGLPLALPIPAGG